MLAVAGVGMAATAALAQPARPGTMNQREVLHHFPPAPRELTLQLTKFREALQAEKFAEAAAFLAELLQVLEDQDHFVVDITSRVVKGFRSEVERVSKTAPPAFADQFQERFGAESQRMLDDALANFDQSKLESCVRKWFLTQAGQQACLLLARVDLDRSEPGLAVRRLMQIETSKPGPHESERLILLARALVQAGREQESTQIWERLKQLDPATTFQLGDEQVRLAEGRPSPPQLPDKDRAAGSMPSVATRDWRSHRGDTAHTAETPWLRLATVPTWNRVTNTDAVRLPESLLENDPLPPTVASPLAVGDQVLARGFEKLHGINGLDGAVVWSYPPDITRGSAPEYEPNEAARTAHKFRLRVERLWRDASFGRFASDGQRVFFIEQREYFEPTDADPLAQARFAILGRPESSSSSYRNQLVALDLTRQGAFSWMVGGNTGESEPKLADASFLGSPLPVKDTLYVIAEFKGQATLAALSCATGRMQWSIAIAHLDSQTTANSITRQFAGLSPVYSDGILVCSTSAGAVVAVDIAARQIRWGCQYRDLRTSRSIQLVAGGVPLAESARPTRWRDCDVMIVGASLIIASENDELLCLDLATGAERWRRRRGDVMAVAVVGPERMLLIGEHRLAALNIRDGKLAWSNAAYIAIPGGGSPSGRGVFDGKHFYLPTTDPELIQLNVEDGSIVARHRLKEPLGNLIVHGNSLISQNESKIVALMADPPSNKDEPRRTEIKVASLDPQALVALLGNDQFDHRERATQELYRRQLPALSALAEAASSTDPEVAFRSAAILVRQLDSPDPKVLIQARSILLSKSSFRNPIAANAFARATTGRTHGAIRELRKLGATVDTHGKSVSINTSWRGGAPGLTQLMWLPDLESLELCHSGIDDSSLVHVRGMSQLKSLNLYRSSITSDGLANVAETPKLETLLLQGTRIDDSAIVHLSKLTKLKAVNLLNTQVSAVAAQKLQSKVPGVKVLR